MNGTMSYNKDFEKKIGSFVKKNIKQLFKCNRRPTGILNKGFQLILAQKLILMGFLRF